MEITLLTQYGNIKVIFSGKDEIEQMILTELFESWQNEAIWNCDNWSEVKAVYRGEEVGYIDFKKVVASLC